MFSEALPQISSVGAGAAFAITEITRDAATSHVTLTWNSADDTSYSVDTSTDLVQWSESEDGIASTGATTSFTERNVSEEKTIYFRVREE